MPLTDFVMNVLGSVLKLLSLHWCSKVPGLRQGNLVWLSGTLSFNGINYIEFQYCDIDYMKQMIILYHLASSNIFIRNLAEALFKALASS